MSRKFHAKAIMERYKVPDKINERKEEGFDGHVTWDRRELKLRKTMRDVKDAFTDQDGSFLRNVFKSLGMTPAQSESMTSQLISMNPDKMKEALMSAITIGSRPVVEFILQLFSGQSHEERSGCAVSDSYPPHITPLMLACILNNFAIVECLLLRGHSIQPPHHKNCLCDICIRIPCSDTADMQKVDILRALCSDSYLLLATSDPFAAACAMSSDLDQLMREDGLELVPHYTALRDSVQRFVVQLIDQNWTDQELDIYLSHKCSAPMMSCANQFPRVQLALDHNMTEVIVSTGVQRAMEQMWWSDWANYGTKGWRDAFRILGHGVFFHFLALVHFVSNEKAVQSFNTPVARFITGMAAYMSFVISLAVIRALKFTKPFNHDDWQHRTCLGFEIYAYAYLLGMMVERCLLFVRHGFENYFKFWWRWFDVVLISVMLICMHLWIAKLTFYNKAVMKDLPREHWDPNSYALTYDMFMNIALILACWRLIYYFQVFPRVGITVISVARCISSIYSYLVMMVMVTISFIFGLSMLIQRKIKKSEIKAESYRESFESLFRLQYYGNAEPNAASLRTDVDEMNTFAGETMVALFHGVIIIAGLNMIVSLVLKRAEQVLVDEEREFKYTRVVIYSEFLHWFATIPPPISLISMIVYAVTRPFSGFVFAWPEIFIDKKAVNPESEQSIKECVIYNSLMLKFIDRYKARREHHFRTVFRSEFDTVVKKYQQLPCKVAFFSDFSNDPSEQRSEKAADAELVLGALLGGLMTKEVNEKEPTERIPEPAPVEENNNNNNNNNNTTTTTNNNKANNKEKSQKGDRKNQEEERDTQSETGTAILKSRKSQKGKAQEEERDTQADSAPMPKSQKEERETQSDTLSGLQKSRKTRKSREKRVSRRSQSQNKRPVVRRAPSWSQPEPMSQQQPSTEKQQMTVTETFDFNKPLNEQESQNETGELQ